MPSLLVNLSFSYGRALKQELRFSLQNISSWLVGLLPLWSHSGYEQTNVSLLGKDPLCLFGDSQHVNIGIAAGFIIVEEAAIN